MTDKSAIRYLREIKSFARKMQFDAKYIDALALAIKALEEHCKDQAPRRLLNE